MHKPADLQCIHELQMRRKQNTHWLKGVQAMSKMAKFFITCGAVCVLGIILTAAGYAPYYLYRQGRIMGNQENVGWAKDGHDGLYNVFMMDETHTVLGCGAGAVTKLKCPEGEHLERIFNYKFPYEYIDRFEEMLRRKQQVVSFYESYGGTL